MEAAQARLSLYLSKCHIVGNHMSRLIYMDDIGKKLKCPNIESKNKFTLHFK